MQEARTERLYSRSGFDGSLVKPVSGQQLEETVLAHLPETIVTRQTSTETLRAQTKSSKGYTRKIPIAITINSMCDLPDIILKNLQIDAIPFKILSEGREYYDGIEADPDEVLRYMGEGKHFSSEPPTATEFEQFFEKELKKAHQVIHITLSAEVSKEYENAKEAAKAYGNVYVFNSGINSSAMGIMALLAYHMAGQGFTPGKIIGELNNIKKNIHCSFVASDPGVLYRRGFVGKGTYGFMQSIGMKPFMLVKDSVFRLDRAHFGDTWKGYKKYIEYALPRNAKPNLDFVFITHAGVSEEMLEKIKEKVLLRFPFKNVIFQKACAVMSISCGSGAFAIMYIDETDRAYNLEKLVSYDENIPVPVHEKNPATRGGKEASVRKEEWFEGIEGIDKNLAIENSGSEESFLSVLPIFYNSIEEKAKELEDYYKNEDFESYTTKVHALKSSARLVGAQKLSKDAEDLEMAGKAGDISFIRRNHDSLMEELRGFKEPLKKYYEKNPVMEDDAAADDMGDTAEDHSVSNEDLGEILIKSMYTAEAGAKEKNKDFLGKTFKEMEDYFLFSEQHVQIITKLRKKLS